jgi:hypothetical protein
LRARRSAIKEVQRLETLITYLPLLACGAMMLFICIPMMRNKHKGDGDSAEAETRQEIAELREEIARLRAEKTLDSDEERIGG